MTFAEFARDVRASYEEQRLLVFHLAAYRMRRTLELIPDEPEQDAAYIIAKFNANVDDGA